MFDIDLIRIDGGTQPRDHINREVLERYTEALGDGAVFPPVVLYHDGEAHWLADGFHRLGAHKALGLCEIAADIQQGTRRDAVLYSAGANATHGYPRSNADKRRAVTVLLKDEEWVEWSDNEIARKCAVSQPFVSKIRGEIYPEVATNNGYKSPRKSKSGETRTTKKRKEKQPKAEQKKRAPEEGSVLSRLTSEAALVSHLLTDLADALIMEPDEFLQSTGRDISDIETAADRVLDFLNRLKGELRNEAA